MAKSRRPFFSVNYFSWTNLFFHYSSLFRLLFQAILAAVVIANLIGLLRQFSRLKDLWRIHKPDAVRRHFVTCKRNICSSLSINFLALHISNGICLSSIRKQVYNHPFTSTEIFKLNHL